MKLRVGRVYHTRAKLREGVTTGKVVSLDEFKQIFGQDREPYNRRGSIVVYGIGTERVTYSIVSENGRVHPIDNAKHDLVRPVGNILNE